MMKKGHVKKRAGQKDKVNFKVYDTAQLTNNCNIHIDQEVKAMKLDNLWNIK